MSTDMVYGGKYTPATYSKKAMLDDFLEVMIQRKCNCINDICKRLKVTKSFFMACLNTDKFITNGYYIAPKRG
ncbi:hypothetical protein I3271_05645 [Photobacterium leiognathi]|uniref:hypothetical protein n=1 Tax=Photobacterium leiognathi TaxID=553611 RepID=UPI001EDF4727|nr:hypothetical protein [Photobacterium leiognathi]MCG3884165.1 hypothetical protein [Photobacterium leiognathi]